MHKSLTLSKILRAVARDANTGYCRECGAYHSNVEPDASDYVCTRCGKPAVAGAEELLIEVA